MMAVMVCKLKIHPGWIQDVQHLHMVVPVAATDHLYAVRPVSGLPWLLSVTPQVVNHSQWTESQKELTTSLWAG